MSGTPNSNRIVDLAQYRAARAAASRLLTTRPAPYLLWYPGIGYVQVDPAVAPFGARNRQSPPASR